MADDRARLLAEFIEPLRGGAGVEVEAGYVFRPGYKAGFLKKKDGTALLNAGVEVMAEYQARLAAQDTWGVLVCLQALDAGGKDGTIRHVMSGVNPQGVRVSGFRCPRRRSWTTITCGGMRGGCPAGGRSASSTGRIMRRSLWCGSTRSCWTGRSPPAQARGKGVWERRYAAINDCSVHPAGNGFKVVKLFLNMSKEEQRIRFLRRVDAPEKNWKFSAADARERKYWDDYQAAFSEMLSSTSTGWAPWYVIPADHKWFARVCVSAVLAHTLMEIDPKYPYRR